MASSASSFRSDSANSAHSATPAPANVYASVEVIDPANRTGKIVVPRTSIVQETRGLLDHLVAEKTGQWAKCNRTVRDLSLCLLFVKGRCHAGARCNQVHVDPQLVEEKRVQAASACNCCAGHGDCHSTSHAQSDRVVIIGSDRFLLKNFATTGPLEQLLALNQEVPAAAWSKVCRLHRENRCKFGRDCKYLHLCGKAAPLSAATAAPTKVSAPVAAAAAVPTKAAAAAADLPRWSFVMPAAREQVATPPPPATVRHSTAAPDTVPPSPSLTPACRRFLNDDDLMCSVRCADESTLSSFTFGASDSEFFELGSLSASAPPAAVARCLNFEELALEMSKAHFSPFQSPMNFVAHGQASASNAFFAF